MRLCCVFLWMPLFVPVDVVRMRRNADPTKKCLRSLLTPGLHKPLSRSYPAAVASVAQAAGDEEAREQLSPPMVALLRTQLVSSGDCLVAARRLQLLVCYRWHLFSLPLGFRVTLHPKPLILSSCDQTASMLVTTAGHCGVVTGCPLVCYRRGAVAPGPPAAAVCAANARAAAR